MIKKEEEYILIYFNTVGKSNCEPNIVNQIKS